MTDRARAVFLDRDGTLIEEVGYLDRFERLSLFPWSVDAVRLLNQAGYKVVVITNQAGVARGMFAESFVTETHNYLAARMTAGRARIDRFYYCPHHPDGSIEAYRQSCDCRKPLPGMIRAAARDLDIDLAASFTIGDRWPDLQAGRAAGTRTVLVRTGYGRSEEGRPPEGVSADAVADNLIAAVSWILEATTRGQV
jgi:D-glycero-D-manno-heptose 1,7-bisphosphate phosphatase